MISKRLRAKALHPALALALSALVTSSPVQAVDPTLPHPQTPVQNAVVTVEPILPEGEDKAEGKLEIVGEGEASYYGHELAGNRTASGEIFRPDELTAAHRTLPLGSKLRVTNMRNGKSVIVRVNDRGPFVKKRIVDISLGAAREIQMVRAGKANVRLELLR